MELTPEFITSWVTTTAGAVIAAGIISRGIDGLKKLGVSALEGREKLAALGGTVALVAFALFVGVFSVPPVFVFPTLVDAVIFAAATVVAGYGILKIATGVHDDISHSDRPSSLTNSTGWQK